MRDCTYKNAFVCVKLCIVFVHYLHRTNIVYTHLCTLPTGVLCNEGNGVSVYFKDKNSDLLLGLYL